MTRSERIRMRSRMQRRIRLVVEERRMALALPPRRPAEPPDPERPVGEATEELPLRAVGRVAMDSPAAS